MGARDVIQFYEATIVCLGLLAVGGGCQRASSGAPKAVPSGAVSTPPRVVTGTVRHIEVEGGFYGIVTDDGTNLDPVNLPEEFQKDGLRLEARVVPLRDGVSIHMWGTPVRIIEFKRL